MKREYENQVQLLINCLPVISEYVCFALKGGTAINLFYRNLPRLSVDIDLVYIKFSDRKEAFEEINDSLENISNKLKRLGFGTCIKSLDGIKKLICTDGNATIKIEPNYLNRGTFYPPVKMQTAEKVQEKFGFSEINVISKQELFGGKICAALDRQHPRDLFDVSLMIKNQEIDENIKDGFIIEMLCHNRNFYELLTPNLKDREEIFKSQFKDMTDDNFTYDDHISTFNKLVPLINSKLTDEDKNFLKDFVNLQVDFENCRFTGIEKLSAVRWKIQNLQKLKETQLEKFNELKRKNAAALKDSQNIKKIKSRDDDYDRER